MCLAIPGQIVEFVDEPNSLARVDVAGVRRTVNVGLLDAIGPGDWVLVHVGFALSQVDEEEAEAARLVGQLFIGRRAGEEEHEVGVGGA